MEFSYISRLFKQLSRSRWIQVYFSLVILQTILSIPILVKTLINTELINTDEINTNSATIFNNYNRIFGNYFITKGYKIIYENVLFIVYESWRIWILIDGIVHLNSLTILASAWFSVFSCMFNVMLVIESRKWVSVDEEPLKMENLKLQIALAVTFFLLSIPVIISAYKSSKVIGWQVYKKIGGSIELQNMYHNVQWFALLLKVDIFFQVFLLVGATVISDTLSFRIFSIVLSVFLVSAMVLSRISITKESSWMMLIFIMIQVILLGFNIYTLIGLFQYPAADLWFAGIIYVIASIICVVINIYLAIRCQVNFGKGLKPFVEWYPFQRKRKTDGLEELSRKRTVKEGLLGARIDERLPIDDEEEDQYFVSRHSTLKVENDEEVKYVKNDTSYHTLQRTSMERVYSSNTPSVNNAGVIVKIYDNKYYQPTSSTPSSPTTIVPRMALQPIILRPSVEMSTIDISDSSSISQSNPISRSATYNSAYRPT